MVGRGGGGSVGWGGLVGLLLGVDSGALVGDISDKSVISVAGVGHVLDSAIGKVDRVLTINNTVSIIVLSLVEGSSRVVIGNSVVESVCRGLREIISIGDWALPYPEATTTGPAGRAAATPRRAAAMKACNSGKITHNSTLFLTFVIPSWLRL